jgi:F-box domain
MNIIDLPIDVLGIIFNYVNLELIDIVAFRKMCKTFDNAFNSPKLSYLFHGKYEKWWMGRLIRGEHLCRNPRYLRFQEKIHINKRISEGRHYNGRQL